MLSKQDLKEYFETYIYEYQPYKNYEVYQQIMNFLIDYYYEHTYETIPKSFKEAYEHQEIPSEMYDPILLSNGLTEDIIGRLNDREKNVLINTFTDFHKYKGTVGQITTLGSEIQDNHNWSPFNIFELFIDYQDGDWVFIPKPIYIDPKLRSEYQRNRSRYSKIAFDTIQSQTNTFLLTEEQLEEERLNESIILPIKTNILSVEYTRTYRSNPLRSLFFTIFFKSYKDEQIVLYLEDGKYQTTLENTYKLWTFILYKYFDKNLKVDIPDDIKVILFDFDNVALDDPYYDITNIPNILDEYNNLNRKLDIQEFYYNKIQYPFEFAGDVVRDLTPDELESYYRQYISSDLLDYVVDKIENEGKPAISQILDEIYNSIVTWSVISNNSNISDNVRYFLDELSFILTNPPDTNLYNIIEYVKPYHVELIAKALQTLEIDNKFNNFFIEHSERKFYTQDGEVSAVQATALYNSVFRSVENYEDIDPSYDYLFNFSNFKKESNEKLTDQSKLEDNYRSSSNFTISTEHFEITKTT